MLVSQNLANHISWTLATAPPWHQLQTDVVSISEWWAKQNNTVMFKTLSHSFISILRASNKQQSSNIAKLSAKYYWTAPSSTKPMLTLNQRKSSYHAIDSRRWPCMNDGQIRRSGVLTDASLKWTGRQASHSRVTLYTLIGYQYLSLPRAFVLGSAPD